MFLDLAVLRGRFGYTSCAWDNNYNNTEQYTNICNVDMQNWYVIGLFWVAFLFFFRLCPETSRDFRQRVGHMLHQKLFFLKVALPAIEGKVITGCTFWEQKNFRSPAVRSAAAEDVFFSELKQRWWRWMAPCCTTKIRKMDLGDILNSLNVKYIFCEFCWLGGSTPIKSKLFQRIYKNILWMTQASQDGGPGISDAIHMSGEKRRQWQRVLWYRGGNFGVHDGSRPQEGRLVLLIQGGSPKPIQCQSH